MEEYRFVDLLMPIPLVELFELPMIRQASLVNFTTISLAEFCAHQKISTKELLDFLKDGPEDKTLLITEHFLEDGHAELLRKLREVSFGRS